MQGHILVASLFFITLTEGFLINFSKCPIKKHKATKYIKGDPLLVHKDFEDRLKSVEKAAKDCNVHVYVKGSYFQTPDPAQAVPIVDADLAIGHGFRFELRDTNDALVCNSLCLSRNPSTIFEVKCFLETVVRHGLVWSMSNSNVISDGTYEADKRGYHDLKKDIQTKCQKESFKRQLQRALLEENGDDQDSEGDSQDNTDDTTDKKKK
ncbi:unnamed protein product [Rotaria sp. Silwood1]|nr:unnamed protein product [Rotaria sp. Silwood1]CAF3432942.1 unnamed protein product [Rotaria sp. Silwood1]CAF3486326.1 unnamed protein product [Rotaria sp. Silwood1]CAF4491462.1 unnamed protein product [Rotaria sp. Silwood1]CAF4566936.1 unnamed protein product [Rotaria sp. Silwood1]